MSTVRDYYEILGVPRDADEATIKKSFRRLARELHPDVNQAPDAEERFKEAAEAYEVLSDGEKRATYDRFGHDGLRRSGAEPDFSGFASVSDIFDMFFGGGFSGRGGGGVAQGGDVAADVEITLAEVLSGASRELSYEVVARCERCHGNRAEPGTPLVVCERCGGQGRLQGVQRTPFGQMMRTMTCDACAGEGRIARTPCESCEGRGRTVEQRRIELDIPAGIEHGQRIRLSGRGHAGDGGGPPGDLYVRVRVADDERYIRDGRDLVTALDVPAPLAALGARIPVETLEGPEDVEIPAGTQPGAIISLRGRGLPALRGGRRGDLRVVANVVIPRRLSKDQRALLEQLAAGLGEDNLRTDEGLVDKLRRLIGG